MSLRLRSEVELKVGIESSYSYETRGSLFSQNINASVERDMSFFLSRATPFAGSTVVSGYVIFLHTTRRHSQVHSQSTVSYLVFFARPLNVVKCYRGRERGAMKWSEVNEVRSTWDDNWRLQRLGGCSDWSHQWTWTGLHVAGHQRELVSVQFERSRSVALRSACSRRKSHWLPMKKVTAQGMTVRLKREKEFRDRSRVKVTAFNI